MKRAMIMAGAALIAFSGALVSDSFLTSSYAKITKENGGGNTPGGNANGVPSTNPAGNEPPGQNKKSTGNPN